MAWFKKLEEGDLEPTPAQPAGRPAADAAFARADARDVRAEARTPAPRAPGAAPAELAADPAPEVRPAQTKAAEPRIAEPRVPDVRAAQPVRRPAPSVLGATLRFRGELKAEEDLIVQGAVDGSITHTQTLTIGTEGSMKGDVRARVVVVEGKVDGNLYASESISVRATAKVRGNLIAPRVGLAEGAFFQGQIEMQAAASQERARPAGAAAKPLDNAGVDQVLSGT